MLIFGGSQGAHAINVAMVEAAPQLAAHPGGVAITHQTGERDLELVRTATARAGLEARVEPFLFAMDREMKGADLIVCRAGATTIAELTAAGRRGRADSAADRRRRSPAEERRGARSTAGAAEIVEQRDLTGDRLAARIATSSAIRRSGDGGAARTMRGRMPRGSSRQALGWRGA